MMLLHKLGIIFHSIGFIIFTILLIKFHSNVELRIFGINLIFLMSNIYFYITKEGE